MEEVWPSDTSDNEVEPSEQVSNHPSQPIWQFLFFLLFWQALFRISNAALTSLLCFFKYFTRLLGNAFQCDQLTQFSEKLPRALSAAFSIVGITGDEFVQYVVCPSCHSIYNYVDCVATLGGSKVSKRCSHRSYPNHPQRSRRQECGAVLLKKVRSGRGYRLVPIKVFPYFSLQKSLQRLASKPGFLNDCERWRTRTTTVPSSHLGDIYDGRVWHEFCSPSASNFLAAPFSYLLTLNVDWFQPFIHSQYSVGAMYLSIQNLPRNQRFKEENIALVGVLPGPSEPSLAMNSYLAPLVEELKQGWENGFSVTSPQGVQVTIRVALSCVSCDIPAGRKVCGFLGHTASLACNKCLKKFSVTFGCPIDYSGFDRNNWDLRSVVQHREQSKEILKETTKTGMRKAESKYGLRYSVLLNLPYFDPVRFTALDIMHNLYLGTGKHAFKVWVNKGLLGSNELNEIDRRTRLFYVPPGIGRLPINFSSNYGGFKADQWRSWITIYSPVVLKGVLPNEHLHCWLIFVRACSILSQRIIKKTDVNTADLLLLRYCEKFEELYGKENCTMNLHLHLHIKESILDFGPTNAFWCFPFERYNGTLGSYLTNMKAVEVQFMRKFISKQSIETTAKLADPQLMSLLPVTHFDLPCASITTIASSLAHTEALLNIGSLPISLFQNFCGLVQRLPPFHERIFPSTTVQELELIYKQLYPHQNIAHVPPFYSCCGRVTIGGDLVGSMLNAASANSASVVMAHWPTRGNDLSAIDFARMRVGVIQFFFKHSVTLSSEDMPADHTVDHTFAYIHWKQKHPTEEWFGISATVSLNMFEPTSVCSFVPVQ